jgi:hypothetical protein
VSSLDEDLEPVETGVAMPTSKRDHQTA